MKKQWRRVLALALVLIFSLGWSAPAAQADYNGAAHTVSNMWDTAFRATSPLYALVRGYLEDKENPSKADMKQAYNQYTQNIQNNYNTTIIDASGNGLIPLTGWFQGPSNMAGTTDLVMDPTTGAYTAISAGILAYTDVRVDFSVTALAEYQILLPSVSVVPKPYSGEISVKVDDITDANKTSNLYRLRVWDLKPLTTNVLTFRPGRTYSLTYNINSDASRGRIVHTKVSGLTYLRITKLFAAPDVNINIDSRLGPFVGNFGYYDVDGNLILAPEISIVNEGNKTYYNPVTQETVSINDWNYDYSDRSYNLTTVDNKKVSVTYGDETIVIKEGDTTYNVYYVTEAPVEPTPTPPPSPTPTVQPTPGPSGEPMPSPSPGPENPDEPGGILGLLKDIWNAIIGIPKAILDGLIEILKALFIPSEDVTAKFQEQVDKKLPVIGDLQGVGDDLVSNFSRESDPFSDARMTTQIDLSKAANGKYGTAKIDLFDLSWYVPYRPLVDDIIVGFAWIVFLWNLYGAMPSIIHGGASGLHTTSQIEHAQQLQEKKRGRK